jgi:hypothetical protein
MQGIVLPRLEPRLQKRFMLMVTSHLHAAPGLAAGVRSLPRLTTSAQAATQAAWRFLNNDLVALPALVEPLREVGRNACRAIESPFVMLVHDWCKLSLTHRKEDEFRLTHSADVGYELTTALLVSPDDGSPLAPMEMHLRTARGVLSTCEPAPRTQPHLEQILATMQAGEAWDLDKPMLHVIDREADSVDHYRRWDDAGQTFLIRADDRRVLHEDEPKLLSEIVRNTEDNADFARAGTAEHRGRAAELWVAETEVVLHRAAKKNVKGRRSQQPGRALSLRLIVVQLRRADGRVLAEWKLLSNAPHSWADAVRLARCYYWRWRIESFFKLLKSHGVQLEQWQQQTGPAIARRLLVASMACVVVWELMADQHEPATELKRVLIRLSGRQMKHNKPYTAPALLAGLWTLLSMLELLNHVSLDQIQRLAANRPLFNTS